MSSGFDVAERARKEMQEIGGKCGNNNKYTHWYSDNVENIGYNFWWCAAFVSYVVRQCGVPTSIVPNYSYCPNCIDWARKNGRLHSKHQVTNGTYTPHAGDIFLREGHTGIIVSVSGNSFTTVEGNTGGTSNCSAVGSHTWRFAGGNYDYVFNPEDFEAGDSYEPTPEMKTRFVETEDEREVKEDGYFRGDSSFRSRDRHGDFHRRGDGFRGRRGDGALRREAGFREERRKGGFQRREGGFVRDRRGGGLQRREGGVRKPGFGGRSSSSFSRGNRGH